MSTIDKGNYYKCKYIYQKLLSGAIAAAFTTPMDVIKTRIMLEEKEKIEKIKKNLNWNMAKQVYSQKGIRG